MKNFYLDLLEIEQLKILDTNGKINPDVDISGISTEDLQELMHRMVFTRAWDTRAMALAKQGRLGFYAPVAGQEASKIGSSFALNKTDWILPGYRDIPQLYWHGYPMYQAFLWSKGHLHGGQIPDDVNMLMPQIIIGAQYVQANGVAMGLKKKGSKDIVITYTGDGGSSEGDFYEALNFAGVYKLPVVFVVQNNGYAISTSRELQTAANTIAQKGIAAGIPSLQVDGMDVLAVFKATQEAAERARLGEGPTLIEFVTYRMEPHSMSGDDPNRYRPANELDDWRQFDPIARFRKYLEAQNLWTEADQEKSETLAKNEVMQAISDADKYKKMNMNELIDNMYETTPDFLEKQKKWYRTEG